jgi:virginiamycin B lyase
MRPDTLIRAATAAAVLLALSACVGAGDAGSTPSASRQQSPTPSASGSVPVDDVTELEGVLSIPAKPFPDWITATEDGVWVANVGPGVVRYGDDGTEQASFPAGSIDLGMEQGFDSLWIGADVGPQTGEVVRVMLPPAGPESVTRIPVPALAEESSIAVTGDAVWLLAADHSLVKVDPASNTVATTVPAPQGASALRGGFGALWVTLGPSGQVARLDPATAQVITSIQVGSGPAFLAIGPDAVWVMNQLDGSVSRVDPNTNSVTATIGDLGAIQGGDITASGDSVWVRTSEDLAVEIDPATDEIVRRLGPPQGSGSIAVASDGAVWISAHDVTLVYRVP